MDAGEWRGQGGGREGEVGYNSYTRRGLEFISCEFKQNKFGVGRECDGGGTRDAANQRPKQKNQLPTAKRRHYTPDRTRTDII